MFWRRPPGRCSWHRCGAIAGYRRLWHGLCEPSTQGLASARPLPSTTRMTTKSVSTKARTGAPTSKAQTRSSTAGRKPQRRTVDRMKQKIDRAQAGDRKAQNWLGAVGQTDAQRAQRLASVLAAKTRLQATKLASEPEGRVELTGGAAQTRDPLLKPTTDAMLQRLSKSKAWLAGETPKSMFEKYILNNRNISDDMIRQMTKDRVPLRKLADSPADAKRALQRIANVRDTKNHKFTVDLLAGITGHAPAAISKAAPALGMTGTPSTVFWNPKSPPVQRFTALHDATSYLKDAGVKGLNEKMWGIDNNVASALLGFPVSQTIRHEADVVRLMRRLDPEGANYIRRQLEEGSEGQLRIMERLFGR